VERDLLVSTDFRRHLISYVDDREAGLDVKSYELRYPIFKESYERLGKTKLNSLHWQRSLIEKALNDISPSTRKDISKLIEKYFHIRTPYRAGEVKSKLKTIYSSLGVSANAKAIDLCKYCTVVPNRSASTMMYTVVRFQN